MKTTILTFLVMWVGFTLTAQDSSQMLDPKIRYGVLDNGMTYYLLHNEEPKERASFYMVHNVGAILEEDDQNGLAHMLEHLAFNGSDNFPGKGIKNFLERHGVEFGSNINAYTAQDETVYNISNVPTEKASVMDSCVLILHDWSGSLTMAGEEIDAERGVIKEEWRSGNSAYSRMQKKLAPTTYYQSKYAERDVIGDMDVIDNSPYSAIRSFYQQWYKPELQATVIVGDFDLDEMEARVKNILSQVPKSANPITRPDFEVANNDGFLYDYATDEEAQYVQYALMIKHQAVPVDQKGIEYMTRDLMMGLYSLVVRERLANIQQKPKAPFIGAQIGYYSFTKTMDAYFVGGAKPQHIDLLGSMKALLIENERIRRFGITPTELERAKINMMKAYEEAVKNMTEVSNDQYAMSIKDHFLSGEPKIGAENELQFAKGVMQRITAEQISEMMKEWITDNNRVVTIQGPKNVDFDYPAREEIAQLFQEINDAEIDQFVDNVVTAPLVSNEPTPGTVLSLKSLTGLDAKEYTLSNNAKVVIYPTDKNENEILFSAYSPGGKSLLATADLSTSEITADVADLSGIAEHSLEDLRQLLVGKQIGLQAAINQYSESLNGSSTPEDIETLLQLIYLTFESPRFDNESFQTITDQMKLQLENSAKNLQKVFFDSVSVVNAGGQLERRPLRSNEMIESMKYDRIESIYKDRIKDAGDFVFVFVGAIDEEVLLPLVMKYIGSISDSGRRESWKDEGIRPFGNGYEKSFAKEMETPKNTVYIKYQGQKEYSRENEVVMAIAKSVLFQRYFETVREQEGGSYGVGVYNGFRKIPYDYYSMIMYFDCDPDKSERLVSIIHKEMDELINNGPSEDDFQKAIEGMVKKREQSLEQNETYLNGLINQYSRGINTALPMNYEDIVNGMTVKQFSKAFKKIMNDSNTLSVIMKPE